jgi:hypothetical protein
MKNGKCRRCGYEGGPTVSCLCMNCASSHIAELEAVLRLIADQGGDADEELGVNCNGRWCREQARTILSRQ